MWISNITVQVHNENREKFEKFVNQDDSPFEISGVTEQSDFTTYELDSEFTLLSDWIDKLEKL